MPDSPGTSAVWLIEEWISKLASSVEMMTEARPDLKAGERATAASSNLPAGMLWHSIPVKLPASAAIFLGAPEESWLHIGRSAMSSAGVADASPEDARGAYLEIVAQATSGVAQALSVRLGKSVSTDAAKQIDFGQEDLRETTELYPVDISLQEATPRRIYVGWTNVLELAAAPAVVEGEGVEVETVRRRAFQPEKSTTFDLLMEVELPVSVSFGRAQLPLRDVLKLNSGSIVELNRTISDPVEIIVNNCVIARGEVVVVDGNYGVRIQHVISREERLRTLKCFVK